MECRLAGRGDRFKEPRGTIKSVTVLSDESTSPLFTAQPVEGVAVHQCCYHVTALEVFYMNPQKEKQTCTQGS